ncbi:MAG: twin-arginine translocase subunit TatB [Methylococcales bacterium]|jgi:sec-independent protein translocase protein TatB|nr:twin-arginine translocase subunit TatB [Methylococcales bacterium]
MFDVGFFELLLIAIVALLVIGPERMPAFARTAGKWVGRAKRAVNDVKTEISKEIKADELKEIIKKQAQVPNIEDIIEFDDIIKPQPKLDKTDEPDQPKQ